MSGSSPLLRRRILAVSLVAANVLLDQATKSLAIHAIKGSPVQSFAGDLFRLEYAENPGAFLSLGSVLSPGMRFWLLTVAVGIFLLVGLVYLLRSRALNRSSLIGISLLVGGGLSNFLDRLLRTEGRVVDFMNLGIGGLRTGIFNVADVAIMVGIAFMVLDLGPSKKAATTQA